MSVEHYAIRDYETKMQEWARRNFIEIQRKKSQDSRLPRRLMQDTMCSRMRTAGTSLGARRADLPRLAPLRKVSQTRSEGSRSGSRGRFVSQQQPKIVAKLGETQYPKVSKTELAKKPIFDGRYYLLEEKMPAGQFRTFIGQDVQKPMNRAVIKLAAIEGQAPEAVAAMVRRIKLLICLKHSHLVPVLNFGQRGYIRKGSVQQ